jgi:cardiolipin synthase
MEAITNLNIPGLIALILYILNILSLIMLLFVERKEPVQTMSWILVIVFLPVVGVILYIFLGRGFKISAKKTLEAKLRDDENLHEAADKIDSEYFGITNALDSSFCFCDPKTKDYLPLIKLHYLLGNDAYTQDNSIEIYVDAKDKYDALIKDIENAEKSINLLYFIFQNDATGERFINALTKKASEGVEVRVIYDDMGSILTRHKAFAPLINAGGSVCRFFPLNFKTFIRANYRNHRKIAVIDGKIGYTGGTNIGDEYLGLRKRTSPWRDTHIRITGHAVYALQARFLMDWYYASKDKRITTIEELTPFFPSVPKDLGGSVGMQIVSSGPDTKTDQILIGFIKMFGMAKKSILIQTPYFIPDRTFIQSLQIAASSGINVKVMIPGIPDKKTVYQVTLSYIQDLLDYGIEVYCYNGFLHSKMIVIDDEIATIGTCNMDMRSFSIHFEINAFIYDEKVSIDCRKIFEEDMKKSKKIDPEEFKKRNIFTKLSEGVLRLIAPLM